ncbi:MAG: 6-bladed beta-propeller [Bacteroidetes bacterium]|jgi:hypothetical protein|nr:6-bladed beta-propeller [Bacteroidota bacterium]MBT3747907.1 6-bladed beta-propeller [Bacteroidota bacterium]MBT4410605.1 6-bladed beta-propeller [Bacteroidota bacterium]MBT7094511.1 6-bladed beta-propeller [Bacteroidota bacterium]MBT7466124.1 6-bladed beta-propeller [Bacteroidota bacterium]
MNSSILNKPEKNEIVLCGDRKMSFYTIEGKFVEKQNVPLRSWNIAALGDDYFGFVPDRFHRGRMDSVGKYKLIITNREGAIIDRKFEFPYYIISGGHPEFIQTNTNSGYLFAFNYDLNIYQLGPGPSITVKYAIDFNQYNPDTSILQKEQVEKMDDLYKYNDTKMIMPSGIAETSNTLVLRCGSNKHQKLAFRLINLHSRKHKTIVMNTPPKPGFFHGWPIYSYHESNGDYVYHPLTSLDVLETLHSLSEEQKEKMENCQGFTELINLKEDDNPVLILYKIKDF